MLPTTKGSLWLFRAFDIDVHVHWYWFPVAVLQIATRPDSYTNPVWKVAEYLSLFAIVLMHEFGHALACRSVGGRAQDIVLWPLGGVAFVAPPARPGALLWSIVAGPLVNFVLAGPLFAAYVFVPEEGWPDLRTYLGMLTALNIGMLVFNLLPVFPLDGGQILHALLWYPFGRWKSLQFVSAIGVAVGVGAFLLLVLMTVLRLLPAGDLGVIMLGFMCLFIASHSAMGFQAAQHVQHLQNLPRHEDCACPSCLVGPPRGVFWVCGECSARFDKFHTRGKCPDCGAWFLPTQCPHCRHTHHIDRWYAYRPGTGPVPTEEPAHEAP